MDIFDYSFNFFQDSVEKLHEVFVQRKQLIQNKEKKKEYGKTRVHSQPVP